MYIISCLCRILQNNSKKLKIKSLALYDSFEDRPSAGHSCPERNPASRSVSEGSHVTAGVCDCGAAFFSIWDIKKGNISCSFIIFDCVIFVWGAGGMNWGCPRSTRVTVVPRGSRDTINNMHVWSRTTLIQTRSDARHAPRGWAATRALWSRSRSMCFSVLMSFFKASLQNIPSYGFLCQKSNWTGMK